MMNFIPIFPLSVAPYPGRTLALNIFEDQYKQLINDCLQTKKPFGIPLIVKGGLQNVGVLVSIAEVKNVFPDGRMQIVVKGESIFHLLEVMESLPDKLYKGAIVKYPRNDMNTHPAMLEKVMIQLEKLFSLSKLYYPVESSGNDGVVSYDIADYMGFTLDQKIEFISLLKEKERLEYMRRHLQTILPVIENNAILSDSVESKGFGLDNFSLN